MEAVYELEYLLLEGHCYEADSGQPPRGLQFILGRTDKPDSAVFDTIVMANLVSTDSSFTDYDVTQTEFIIFTHMIQSCYPILVNSSIKR